MRRTLASVVLISAVTACTPTRVLLAPSSSELVVSADRPAVRLRIPEGVAGGLDVELSSPGALSVEKPDRVAVVIVIDIENRSETKTAGIAVGRARMTDRRGHDLLLVSPAADDPVRSRVVLLSPGERRAFTLRYETLASDDPRDVAPVWIHVPLDYDDRAYNADVHLVRDDPPPYYYYGDPYYPYGYYGSPYPYYGPGWRAHGWYGYGGGW